MLADRPSLWHGVKYFAPQPPIAVMHIRLEQLGFRRIIGTKPNKSTSSCHRCTASSTGSKPRTATTISDPKRMFSSGRRLAAGTMRGRLDSNSLDDRSEPEVDVRGDRFEFVAAGHAQHRTRIHCRGTLARPPTRLTTTSHGDNNPTFGSAERTLNAESGLHAPRMT